MKQYLKTLTDLFRIKNKKVKIANYIITGLLIFYIGLIIYPNFLFGHSIKYKNFRIFSTNSLDNNIYALLDKAESNLFTSTINDTTITHNIYLCNSYSRYAFFAPLSRTAFGCNYAVINNIFISNCNVKKNEAYKNDGEDNYVRQLSQTIAHEITHTLAEKKLGLWKFETLKNWKNEGYCETISYNDILDIATLKDFLESNKNNDGHRIHYKKCYFAVAYLMQIEKMKFEDIIATTLTLDEVLNKIETTKL